MLANDCGPNALAGSFFAPTFFNFGGLVSAAFVFLALCDVFPGRLRVRAFLPSVRTWQ
jgi:hypothetical protein